MLKKITFLLIIALLMSCNAQDKKEATAKVDRHIYVEGKPYTIKGICYHPVPKGSENNRSFVNLEQDLSLMNEAGINTIRVYEPIVEKSVLDQLHQAGIKVVIGFGYNQGGVFDIVSGTYLDYVEKYKNHPAILMWELGNEYNYHPEWFNGDIKNWYNDMNAAAAEIHKIDSNHPVTTAHGDLPDALAISMSPNIDVWGMNVYRSTRPETIFDEWKKVSDKPMYLSETGADSFMQTANKGFAQGENQKAQAHANGVILDKIFADQEICSGVTLFSFLDGWWKAGNPNVQDQGGSAPNSTGVPYDGSPNEEYWGIVDIDRNKKETFDVVKQKYTGTKND